MWSGNCEKTVRYCGLWTNSQTRVSEQELLFYGSLTKNKQISKNYVQDNSYLSAILDRPGLLVAAPVDLRTRKAENFKPQQLQGFLHTLQKKSQDRCDVPDCCNEELQATRSYLAATPFMLGRGGTPNPWRHFFILGPETGRIWWLKKVQHLQKNYHCQWTLLAWRNTPSGIFNNFTNLLRFLGINPSLA